MRLGRRTATAKELRRYIVEELLDTPFDGDDPLAEGAVDSLGIEQLVEYVHEELGVEIEDDEIVDENLHSVDALAALVDSKR